MKDLVGIGIYSIPEASKLTRVPNQTIYRWIRGYEYGQVGTPKKKVNPLWEKDIPDFEGQPAVSFLDLLEIRFISAFRKTGVSWWSIRQAAEKAKEIFDTTHPFTTQKFKTDGRHIFSGFLEKNKKHTLDLNNAMYAFEKIIEPSFYKGIEFESNQAIRWFQDPRKRVVIDPERSFGRPIITNGGVATEVLYASFLMEQNAKAVAEWYGVGIAEVKAAVKFEEGLRH